MSSAEPAPGASPVRWLLAVASACVGAWTLVTLLRSRSSAGFQWVNHDVAFNLYTGRLAFSGQRLYVDRFDTNPPAILLVSGLLDRLASLVHLSPISLFHGAVVLIGTLGLRCVHRTYSDRSAGLPLVSLAYLVVLAGAGLPGEPSFSYSFGQKEHLFALVFVPYLVARLMRMTAGLAFILLAVLLGTFSGFKPQLLVLVALVEIALAIRQGPDWRVWALLAGGALSPYAGLLALSWQSFKAFVPEMIRLHLGGAYAYYDQPFSTFFLSAAHGWVLTYAVLLVCLLRAGRRCGVLSRRLVTGLVAVPFVAYLLVLQQHKFWEYQSIVLASVLLVAIAHAAGALLDATAGLRARWMLELLVAILAVQVLAAEVQLGRMVARWKQSETTEPGTGLLQAAPLLRDRPRTLYYSTSNVYMRLPLYLNQTVVGRWGHDVLFPSIVRDPSGKARSQRIDRYCAEQRSLIEDERPDAIVFHSTGQALESAEQDLHSVLVGRCNVIPADRYGHALMPAPRTVVFLRSDGRGGSAQGAR